MLTVKSCEETRSIIAELAKDIELTTEKVPLARCLGRVLAEDVIAIENLPPFNRSTVDGYAVFAADTFGCSENTPAMLIYMGEVLMGEQPHQELHAGECQYVPTGGQIPAGADAMVMIEYSEDFGDEFRYISKASAPGQHIIFIGDDVRAGEVVLQTKTYLRAQEIGTLAGLGRSEANVYKKPVVGIISSGDELLELTGKTTPGGIYDINTYTLLAGVEQIGCTAKSYGIVKDNVEAFKQLVAEALESCDLLLLSGGSSVGTKDTTSAVITSFQTSEILLHGIAVKPGKPTIIGKIAGKPIFGLPGHPVSAYFIFYLFVRPFLFAIQPKNYTEHTVQAILTSSLSSNHGREEYVPVALQEDESGMHAIPIMGKSGLITTLTKAQGFITIKRDSEGQTAGDNVQVTLF
ncbi:MAG: gephyrin-like molybdotransferase Glp [Clostridia bacterium]